MLGIAAAYCYAADHRERYAAFFDAEGSLAGPGYTDEEAATLPEPLRRPGVVGLAGTPRRPPEGAAPVNSE